MTENASHQTLRDKFEIIEVATVSLCCRDAGDWNRLVQCFHPDSRVTSSWFDGTAREFVAQSSRMMAGHHPTDTQRYMMSNSRVTVKGHRAVCEYYLILYQAGRWTGMSSISRPGASHWIFSRSAMEPGALRNAR